MTEIVEVEAAAVATGGCGECEDVRTVPCEEVEIPVAVVVTTESLFSATVSMAAVSVAAEGDPLLAMEGCEFVRWAEVGGASCCWGGVTGVKADRREGYVNLLSSPAASSLAWEVEEVDW